MEPLERFIFKIQHAEGKPIDFTSPHIKSDQLREIEQQLAESLLQILITQPHYPSRASKYFLHVHLRENISSDGNSSNWIPKEPIYMSNGTAELLSQVETKFFTVQVCLERNYIS